MIVTALFEQITAGFEIAVNILCDLLHDDEIYPGIHIDILGIAFAARAHYGVMKLLHMLLKVIKHLLKQCRIFRLRLFEYKIVPALVRPIGTVEPLVICKINLSVDILFDKICAGEILRRCLIKIDLIAFKRNTLNKDIDTIIDAVQIDLDKLTLGSILDSVQHQPCFICDKIPHQALIRIARNYGVFFRIWNIKKRCL